MSCGGKWNMANVMSIRFQIAFKRFPFKDPMAIVPYRGRNPKRCHRACLNKSQMTAQRLTQAGVLPDIECNKPIFEVPKKCLFDKATGAQEDVKIIPKSLKSQHLLENNMRFLRRWNSEPRDHNAMTNSKLSWQMFEKPIYQPTFIVSWCFLDHESYGGAEKCQWTFHLA